MAIESLREIWIGSASNLCKRKK